MTCPKCESEDTGWQESIGDEKTHIERYECNSCKADFIAVYEFRDCQTVTNN